MMSSTYEAEKDVRASPSDRSSEQVEEQEEAVCCREKSEKRAEDNEEFSPSLSVGDGHYLVDLGSSTEFVVDEACLLELFKSCQKCGRQCRVTKRVHGLKIFVSQRCCFCDHRFGWTNLPDDFSDEEDEVVMKRWTLENGTAS